MLYNHEIISITKIEDVPCKICVDSSINLSKVLILNAEFDTDVLDIFKAELKVNYNVK